MADQSVEQLLEKSEPSDQREPDVRRASDGDPNSEPGATPPEAVEFAELERPEESHLDADAPVALPEPAPAPPGPLPSVPMAARPSPGKLGWWTRQRKVYQGFFDLLWPDLDPVSPEEEAEQARKDRERRERDLAAMHPESGTELPESARRSLLEAIDTLIDDERARRQSVETRLTTVLGFVTVASTIAMAGIGLRVRDGLLGTCVPLGVVAALLVLYIVAQAIRAGLAAIAGLTRGNTDSTPVHITLAAARDAALSAALAEHRMRHFESLCELTNRKVEQLALAHVALRNFLRGAAGLICVVVAMVVGDLVTDESSSSAAASGRGMTLDVGSIPPPTATAPSSPPMGATVHDASSPPIIPADMLDTRVVDAETQRAPVSAAGEPSSDN